MVQAMVVRAKARELILGLADDPTFGTVVVFGRGGTAVEIINDKALALPPLDLQLARSLIERTRVSRLLRAYRDVPAVKPDAVAMVLVKLAQMAPTFPKSAGSTSIPLLADEAGVLAVDARVVIGAWSGSFAVRARRISPCGLSLAMAASHRGQGRLARLRPSDPARGRAADPRDAEARHDAGPAAAVLRPDEGIFP
jgi:hypothetical protein